MSDPIGGIRYGSTCGQATSLMRDFAKIGASLGAVSAATLGAVFNPEALRARRELEDAAMRMAALCSSADMVRIAAGEAKRREALMDRTAAMRSVADDLATGRLRFPR